MRIKDTKGISINETSITLSKNGFAPYINFDNEKADIIILSYQPGFGKTYTAHEYISKKQNVNSYYFTTRHETIEEIIENWNKKNKPIPTHWKGFEKICNNDSLKSWQFLVPVQYICYNCYLNKNCKYTTQFKTKDRVFSPVEYLKDLSSPTFQKTLAHIKTIFIDERISKVDTSSIDPNYVAKVFDKIIPSKAKYKNQFIKEIKNKNYGYFTSKRLKLININYFNTIKKLFKKKDVKTLEKIKGFKPSKLIEFIEWWKIYHKIFPKRNSFGIPFYYYVFDILKHNSKIKIVILDASFNKRLFEYFIYSYNGEKRFNRNIKVQIYTTHESNKNSIVFRMRPEAWHPKANFTKKEYLEYTLEWLPNHINTLRSIFGDDNVGIITFKDIGEQCRKLGYNTEYYGNLRSKNVFENKPVLVILGHFFPPQIQEDNDGSPKNEGIIKMIDEWFLRDKTTYNVIELKDFYQKLKKENKISKERWQRLMKRYLGSIYPRRLIDDDTKLKFNPNDPVHLKPVETIQEYFDDEIYQAIHRNRGLQNNRIIFTYCWLPPYVENTPERYTRIFSQILFKIWNEFDIRIIRDIEVETFFKSLKDQIGNRETITNIINLIDKTSNSNTKIAKELHLYKKEIWDKKIKDGRGGPANLYIKVLRDGIYKRDVGKRKIKNSKYSIQPFLKKDV